MHEYNYKEAIIKTDEGLCSIYDDSNSYATILYKFIELQNYFTPKYLNFNWIPYNGTRFWYLKYRLCLIHFVPVVFIMNHRINLAPVIQNNYARFSRSIPCETNLCTTQFTALYLKNDNGKNNASSILHEIIMWDLNHVN